MSLSQLLQKERKETNITLLKIQGETLEVNKNFDFQNKVISVLIHDLRSPLFFIQRVAKNLQDEGQQMNKEQLQSILNSLHESTSNVTLFITDILYWMHLNQGSVFTKAIPFVDFFQRHCELYMGIVREKNLKVRILCNNAFTIYSDPNYLGIIIRNLFDNATKHTDTGEIAIDAYVTEDSQIIVVSDTGNGMSLERAYELEKGIITRKASGNTQIGFRIVYDLVKKMDGKINVSSNSGGTKITIRLPVFHP